MRAGGIQHDGNPVLEWCLGNVVGKADRPTKQRPNQKIDAAVALIMAIARAMVDDNETAAMECRLPVALAERAAGGGDTLAFRGST